MKVLMVSGDPNVLKQGTGAHERFLLQKSVVDRLEVVIIVRGQLWLVFKKFLRLRGQPFDVVTAQDPFWRGHLAGHLAWLLGAKLNLQVHTDLSALPWLKHRWAIFNLRKADSIRVVSEKIKQQVEHAGVKARVHILPIYIDVERFRHIAHMPQKKQKNHTMDREV